MATLKALQARIAKLKAQAESIAKKESSVVLGKIHALMQQHGLTPEDIAAHFRHAKGGRKAKAATKTTTKTSTKTPRAGNYVRGPQAPMYRDPASGATWSGRGRAPGWLESAKNRADYLIAKPAKKAAKKVAAKKVIAKKAAAKKVAKKAAKK